MTLRGTLHRWIARACVLLGVVGVCGYLISAFQWNLGFSWGYGKRIDFDCGAIDYSWHWRGPGLVTTGPRLGGRSWFWVPSCYLSKSWNYVIVPYWLLVAIGGAYSVLLLPRRPKKDRCINCRYDLRGTPEGPERERRCPECGHAELTTPEPRL